MRFKSKPVKQTINQLAEYVKYILTITTMTVSYHNGDDTIPRICIFTCTQIMQTQHAHTAVNKIKSPQNVFLNKCTP